MRYSNVHQELLREGRGVRLNSERRRLLKKEIDLFGGVLTPVKTMSDIEFRK